MDICTRLLTETAESSVNQLGFLRCGGVFGVAEARTLQQDLPYDLFEDDLSSEWKRKCGISHLPVSLVAGIDCFPRGRLEGASVDEDEVSL